MKKTCIVCRERPAEVPDRERMGKPVKRVCRECHAQRLERDIKRILAGRKGGKSASR